MRNLRNNGLTLVFLLLTLVTVGAQARAGYLLELDELAEHRQPAVTFATYVTSSEFGVDLLENWQSEFFQFSLFILATVWLVQRGSAETKAPGDEGREEPSPRDIAGVVRRHSLLLVMVLCFLTTWTAQAVTGWRTFDADQVEHGARGITLAAYLGGPEFWSRTFQNWQSEFLAVAAMSIFTVYLREAGSPESKRIDALDAANEPTY